MLTDRYTAALIWLAATFLFSSASYFQCMELFDLNEPPDDPGSFEAASSEPVSYGPQNRPQRKTPATAAIKKRKPALSSARVEELYAKVSKLFETLKVCDVEDFDIKRVKLPSVFSAENKAMMVLSKVAESNFIMKSDMPRFERVMRNCNEIARAIQTREEESQGVANQMSGITYQELIDRRKYEMENSPFTDMRSRFFDSSDQSKDTTRRQTPASKPDSKPKPATEATQTHNLEFNLETSSLKEEERDDRGVEQSISGGPRAEPNLIAFL